MIFFYNHVCFVESLFVCLSACNRSLVQPEVLERNIRVVADALSRFLFDLSPSQAMAGEATTVSSAFVRAWLDTVAQHPRSPSFAPANFTQSLAQVQSSNFD
jgi:hypothetical protein